MPLGLWMLVAWMILMACIGIGFLVWGWQSGQFHDIEEPKYRMLDEKEPEPWPGRKAHGKGGGV
jgi:cbb3-type cytochrome oxidase maturation protein